MSSGKIPPPNAGGQPNRLSPAQTVDNYWAEADEILERLSETLKDRPATDDPNLRVDAGIWWVKIISLRLKFNWVMDRFQQDPSIGPTLRAMLHSFLKLNPLEDLLPEEAMSSETFPAGKEMRDRLQRLVETKPESHEEAEEKRIKMVADVALYIWFLAETRKESELEKSEQSVGAPGADRVIHSRSKE